MPAHNPISSHLPSSIPSKRPLAPRNIPGSLTSHRHDPGWALVHGPLSLVPPNLRAWGEQAPRRLTAGGVRTRSRLPKKEEGEGLGPSPVAPKTQAMGDAESGRARIQVSSPKELCSITSFPHPRGPRHPEPGATHRAPLAFALK